MKRVNIEDTPVVMEVITDPLKPSSNHVLYQVDPSPSPPPSLHTVTPFTPSHPSLALISTRQETILLNHLAKVSVAIGYSPRASRLRQKLKMRQRQRNHGYPTFNIDHYIATNLSATVKYVINQRKPYSDQVVPLVQSSSPPPHPQTHPYHHILHHISTFPLLTASSHTPSSRLTALLSGCGQTLTPISSPYTARLLKPYIFRSRELRPLQVSCCI